MSGFGDRGFIIVWRDELDHTALQGQNEPFNQIAAWVWLKANTAWSDTTQTIYGTAVPVKRGQFLTSYRRLATAWRRPVSYVQRVLGRWAADTLIEVQANTG